MHAILLSHANKSCQSCSAQNSWVDWLEWTEIKAEYKCSFSVFWTTQYSEHTRHTSTFLRTTLPIIRDGLGVKKRPWIFSQIRPAQLQTVATISQYYSNPVTFMENSITKPMLTKTTETITEILTISTKNTITNITNHQLLTIKTIT